MACSTGVKAALCCSILGATLVIILSVVIVIGQQTPISVHGSNAHIQEIRQIQSSLIAMDNRVNFSGIGLECTDSNHTCDFSKSRPSFGYKKAW